MFEVHPVAAETDHDRHRPAAAAGQGGAASCLAPKSRRRLSIV